MPDSYPRHPIGSLPEVDAPEPTEVEIEGPAATSELFARSIQQLLSIFVEPELRRRQEAGRAPKPFHLRSFQVVLHADGRAPDVRLNEEVNAIADAQLKAGLTKQRGEAILLEEVERFERLRKPADDEPDAAHATAVRFGSRWLFAFDFRYNKDRAAKLLAAAGEFVETARDALQSDRPTAFVDNLFSAAELTAYADLALLPLRGFAERATHRAINVKVNQFSVSGHISERFRKAFNELSGLRDDLRYVKRDVIVAVERRRQLVEVVTQRYEEVCAGLGLGPAQDAGSRNEGA